MRTLIVGKHAADRRCVAVHLSGPPVHSYCSAKEPRGSMAAENSPTWWRDAVVYQVYIRSFADGDGDGLGDIAGLRSHLDHIAGLGVDAVWINPWYPSP